jgi:hypothetical protein
MTMGVEEKAPKDDSDLVHALRDAAWQCAESARHQATEGNRNPSGAQAYAEAARALTQALYEYQR